MKKLLKDTPMVPVAHGSHVPVLAREVISARRLHTPCEILEIGAGHWSTPMLHGLCEGLFSGLVTVESDPEWRNRFKHLVTPTHDIIQPEDYDNSPYWDLCFIDSNPPETRMRWLKLVQARVYVCHDTERDVYGWDFSGFDSVEHHTTDGVRTTVLR